MQSAEITPEEITNWFLYGSATKPEFYEDRIRSAEQPGAHLAIDAESYMVDGAGRYLVQLFSDLQVVKDFFAAAIADPSRSGSVSLADFLSEMDYPLTPAGNSTGAILQFIQKDIDASSADYAERTYVWGSVSAILKGATLVFDGENSRIDNIKFLPFDTNFDFYSKDYITAEAGKLFLIPDIDPFLLGAVDPAVRRDVTMAFENKESYSNWLSSYSFTQFQDDAGRHEELYTGTLATTSEAGFSILDELQNAGIFDYERSDGGYTNYGTAGADTIAARELERAGVIVAGKGDDDLYGGHKADTLLGGLGADTAHYETEYVRYDYSVVTGRPSAQLAGPTTGHIEVFIGDAPIISDGAIPESQKPSAIKVIDGYGSEDHLIGIERVIATDNNDIIRISKLNYAQINSLAYIDGGSQEEGSLGDKVDVSGVDKSVIIDLSSSAEQTVKYKDGPGPVLYLKNFESAVGSDHDDIILVRGMTRANIDAGDGDDVIESQGGSFGTFYGGDGDDTFRISTPGATIDGGAGADTFEFSKGVLVENATGEDRISFFGMEPRLALAFGGSESTWATAFGGLLKFTFNVDGEMVVGSSLYGDDGLDYMYFANANQDPLAPTEDLTAGVRIGALSFDVFTIQNPPKTSWRDGGFWDFYKAVWHDLESDPLVLDLDGDGLEFTSRLSSTISMDTDGDSFAETTAWVRPDDGFLVVDRNGDGAITADEFFGDATTSGFAALTAFDVNHDGTVDADDIDENADFDVTDLRVWRDADGDGRTDAGELLTLDELGITAINLTTTPSGTTISGNTVTDTATFVRSDGSTGTAANVVLDTDQFNTTYLGDTSVRSEIAAAMPNLKGHGTLTDLHVALSRELDAYDDAVTNGQPASRPLADAIDSILPTLDTPDLETLRQRAMPLLEAWANAAPPVAGVGNNPDLVVLFDTRDGETKVADIAGIGTTTVFNPETGQWEETPPHWMLNSGDPIRDANGDIIALPTLADVLAQQTGVNGLAWGTIDGAEIDFLERFYGVDVPAETLDPLDPDAIEPLSNFVTLSRILTDHLAIRLASEGGLAEYFQGVAYDAQQDAFLPTTDRQLAPMFEAIFADAPGTSGGDAAWLQSWRPLFDGMLTDYLRNSGNGINSYPFLLTNIVAAYENAGLDISAKDAGVAFGIPEDLIKTGTGTLAGSSGVDLFYLDATDQRAEGGAGFDSYIVGENFGTDVIYDNPGSTGTFDAIRFARYDADDLLFTRDGVDLVISLIGTDDTIRVEGQFHDVNLLGIPVSDFSDKTEIEEIDFADGTVWDAVDIARSVSHAEARSSIVDGTDQMDFLDGGAGNDLLIGGFKSDIYAFGIGYGYDIIIDNDSISASPDVVQFGEGITADDLVFDRDNLDLVIHIAGTADTLVIRNQLYYYDDGFGIAVTPWVSQIEGFLFADGSSLDAEQIRSILIAQSETSGDDWIIGYDSDGDILHGGHGNDYYNLAAPGFFGGQGADTILFDRGDGFDIIGSSAGDTIAFGAGISESDLHVRAWYNKAFISIAGTTDVIVVDRTEGADPHDGIVDLGGITFADGSSLDGAGVGTLQTWIDSLGVTSSAGGHLYYDVDLNTQSGSIAGDNAVIRLHDMNASDLRVVSDIEWAGDESNDIYLYAANGADNILALSFLVWRDAQLVFDDGTVWDGTYIRSHFLEKLADDGNGVVYGSNDNDTIDLSPGDNHAYDSGGSDSYIYTAGDGFDYINDEMGINADKLEDDTITFIGVTSSETTFFRPADHPEDLVISIDGSAKGAISITRQFAHIVDSSNATGIERFYFSDGVVVTLPMLQAMLLEQAITNGDDKIYGFSTSDTLAGGAGNDTLVGYGGADTYTWNPGDGNDVVDDRGFDNTDISVKQLQYDRLVLNGVSIDQISADFDGADLLITIHQSGEPDSTIRIVDQVGHNFGADNTIERFILGDGSILTDADMARFAVGTFPSAATVIGSSASETLHGTSGDDVFDAGAGDDYFEDYDGNDVYLWGAGSGNDLIYATTQQGDADAVRFVGLGLDDVTFVSGQTGGIFYAGVTIDATGETLKVGYLDDTELDADFFIFEGGQTLSSAQFLRLAAGAEATSGDDTLSTTAIDGVLAGLEGNDTLTGSSQSNTYLWQPGDGNDRIIDTSLNGYDVLITNGLSAGNMSVVRQGDDIVLVDDITGETITLQGQNDGHGEGVESVLFEDGTQWNRDELQRKAPYMAASGGDVITDNVSDQLKVLVSGNGADTFDIRYGHIELLYASGDGNDVVDYDYGIVFGADPSGAHDVAVLTDLNPDDVALYRVGDDLVVYVTETEEMIRFVNQFEGWAPNGQSSNFFGETGIDELRFANGDFWFGDRIAAAAQTGAIPEITWRGTAGDDNLAGSEFADRLVGNGGDDTLQGGIGDDTYVFALGDGHDTINDGASSSGDRLELNGFDPGDVELTRSGSAGQNLVITFSTSPGDSITIAGGLAEGGAGVVEMISFSDGTQWQIGDIADQLGGWASGSEVVGEDFDYSIGDGVKLYDIELPPEAYQLWINVNGQDLTTDDLTFQFDQDYDGALTIGFAGNSEDLIVLTNIVDEDSLYGLLAGVTVNGENSIGSEGIVYQLENAPPTVFEGTSGDDSLVGTNGRDELYGYDGNDGLQGESGDDALYGGLGDDTFIGGEGYDYNNDEGGSDTYIYNAGDGPDDYDDTGTGTGEVDVLHFNDLLAADFVFSVLDDGTTLSLYIPSTGDELWIFNQFTDTSGAGHMGMETIEFSDGSSLDGQQIHDYVFGSIIVGTAGNDVLTGGPGNDTLIGGQGADVLDGGDGIDTASYETAEVGVIADLSNSVSNTGDAAGDSYTSIENLTGSAYDDELTGSDEDNVLVGGAGDDLLHGGDGYDLLNGGVGADQLDGGSGEDTATYAAAAAGVVANLTNSLLNSGEAAGDTYTNIEDLTGSAFNDTLVGSSSGNELTGGDGADILQGLAGDDVLAGDAGDDHLDGGDGSDVLDGGDGNDILEGGVGFDQLFGGEGDDSLVSGAGGGILEGGSGDDRLESGAGDDVMTGGDGADTFVFSADFGDDDIWDFESGTDTIELSDLGAASFGDLQSLMTEVFGSTTITFSDGSQLSLSGIPISQLTASDFHFV